MGIIQTDFSEHELIELRAIAKAKGMTVEQILQMATRKYMAGVKEHAKERLKPDLKLIK